MGRNPQGFGRARGRTRGVSKEPTGKASAFKVPHHGSMNAHEPDPEGDAGYRSLLSLRCRYVRTGRPRRPAPGAHVIGQGISEAQLLADGVTQSLSRPRVSNDNPYSEAHFVSTTPASPPVRRHRGGEGLLPPVLPVVQPGAQAWRHRPANARTGPLRSRARGHRAQTGGAGRRLRRPARALRGRPAPGGRTQGGGLDQPPLPVSEVDGAEPGDGADGHGKEGH